MSNVEPPAGGNGGMGRELAVSLFRDAKLMHRIVEGQRMNDSDEACAKSKSVRLGFMGHLTLSAEDVSPLWSVSRLSCATPSGHMHPSLIGTTTSRGAAEEETVNR
ncbi:hypothetical protein R3P38DRAFT_3429459 [Favolaschia claudopus]|uniref:Uncharacterized protein n=1 Tax=Favolaschia claudopus TaxID=2862362 RepID=A0AAV9ZUW1_9AGAR